MDIVTRISGHKKMLLQALVNISGYCYKHKWTQVDNVVALVDTSGHRYKH